MSSGGKSLESRSASNTWRERGTSLAFALKNFYIATADTPVANRPSVTAIELHSIIHGDGIVGARQMITQAILDKCTPFELNQVRCTYRALYSRDLDQEIRAYLATSGPLVSNS